MTLDTLYKRTATGAVQIWRIELDGDRYRTISGQKDGAQTTSGWKAAKPKNVGKSNETSAEEQAALEVEAKYQLKLNQGGYFRSEAEIDKAKYFKPMLAYAYEKRPIADNEWGDIYSQPKLDGVRCIATADGLWSRQGKPILSCPHIFDALVPLFEDDPDLVFDGELYADKLADDFNEIISLVRKQKPDSDHFTQTAEVIQYNVYDLPSTGGTFEPRYWELIQLVKSIPSGPIVPVLTTRIDNATELDEAYADYMEDGYEGQMIRRDGPYKNGRSFDLLKRKEFTDTEYTVISVDEGVGNRSGMAGFITYKLGDGRTFKSGIKGSWEYATRLLEDAHKYVGGQGTVRYQHLTPDGVPRFPVTVALYEGGRDL